MNVRAQQDKQDRDAEELISGAGVGGTPKTDGLFPGRK